MDSAISRFAIVLALGAPLGCAGALPERAGPVLILEGTTAARPTFSE